MERPNRLNYWYCVNINCQASIYHGMLLRSPSDEGNQPGDYKCSFCNRTLVPDDEILVVYTMTAVDTRKKTKSYAC